MTNEIELYLNSKGWSFKFKNGEYCLDSCPLCDAGPGHFYINQAKEIFYCHKCNERGHILSLKKRLGDLPAIAHISQFFKNKVSEKTVELSIVEKYHKALLENPAALSYLTQERAFTLDTIKKFKLGFKDGSITIPHLKNGECFNIKYRPLNGGGKKYFREDDCVSILFNLDSVKDKRWVLLCEGELDAIAFSQMGILNAVAVTGGADTFLDEWIDPLESFDQIFISYDMDEVGRKGAEKAADKLGRYRCINVLLPLKDGNDCLKAGYSHSEISDIVAMAKPFDFKIIKAIESYSDELRDHLDKKSWHRGIQTKWKALNDHFGGIRPHELTILTGETGAGKSTFAANLGYLLAKGNYPVLIASFEMKPVPMIKKMLSMETGIPFNDLDKKRFEAGLTRISRLPIHFVDVYGEISMDQLKDAVYYARRRFGIQVVILDNLHFFLKYSGDQERQAIDQTLRNMKAWAMELGIHILLIVHPTKLTYDGKVVHLNDLKGSSGLKQLPDNVLSIWRPPPEEKKKEVVIHILKIRDDAGKTGQVILTFDKRSQSYSEPGPEGATSAEGEGIPDPSPRPRNPAGRDWQSAYE